MSPPNRPIPYRPVKIVHAIGSMSAQSGGPPMVAAQLAQAQARLGHDVHILCHAAPDGNEVESNEGPHADGSLAITRVTPAGRIDHLRGTSAKRALAPLLVGADALHIHGIWEPMLLAAAAAAHAAGVPYAVCPHGMLDTWALGQKSLKKTIALKLAYNRMLNRSAFLHTISQHERDCAAEFGYPNRMEVISNGVDLADIDPLPEPGTFRAERPELGDGPIVLFLSRLAPGKRLDLLVPAFAKATADRPDARLVLVGPDWGAEAPAREDAKRLGIEDRVVFTGPIFGHAKFAALRDASCFSLPSEHEAFSVAILEALAAATPVVISDECHFPEVAQADAGITVPLDADKLAVALKHVLDNPDDARAMGERGRKLIEQHYTWRALAQRLIDVYADLKPAR